jgi:hypothetical protein
VVMLLSSVVACVNEADDRSWWSTRSGSAASQESDRPTAANICFFGDARICIAIQGIVIQKNT